MAVPGFETIAANLLTLLNGVTTGNGYNQTISIWRSKRADFMDVFDRTPVNGNGMLYMTEMERLMDYDSDDGPEYLTAKWKLHFALEIYVMESDLATAVDTLINQVVGDVYKQIMTDPDLSGAAIDTEVTGVTRVSAGANFSGPVIEIESLARHLIADPYTAT